MALQQALLWGCNFLLLPEPPQIFTGRGFEAFFPHTGTLDCMVFLALLLFLWVYLHPNVELPGLPATASPTWSSCRCFVICPCCRSQPLLPVWMNVSSLTPCVGLPYSLIFWQFWLFFVFKFGIVLLLVVQGSKVYLPTPLSWPEVSGPLVFVLKMLKLKTSVMICLNLIICIDTVIGERFWAC